MGLDISKITNAELQKLAYTQDKDNNNFLDSEEFAIFKQEATKQEGISSDDFNQAMGLYKTETAQTTVATTVTTTQELSKKERKAARKNLEARQDDIKNDIKALIDGKKSARLRQDYGISLDDLTATLQRRNSNPDYAGVIAEVQQVVDFVNSTNFNSKKEVEALEKRIKKNKDFNDFQKGLAAQMVELAKVKQIDKETRVLVEIYDKIKSDKNNAQNFTVYLENVKAEIERRGLKNVSYYSDEAFDALEEMVKKDAAKVADKKRQQMVKDGAEYTSKKDVKEALLNSTPETDKLSRKVIKKDKDMNALTGRWLDKDRRAEDLEKITEKELKDELGEDLFNILNRNYLHTKQNSDGTYNVRDLSDALFERVGADVWMNMSDDTPMSELQGAKNELKMITGRDLKDKDIKKIMKLVHIEKEPKNRNILDAIKKSIIPGLAGAIAGASTYQPIQATQRMEIELEEDSANNIIEGLNAAGYGNIATTTNSGGTITITLFQEMLEDERALAALAGAGIGVLTGTIMNLIFGMKNNEESCFSIADFNLTNERYTNIDNYKNYVRETESNSKRADLICALADTMHKEYGDDWAKHYDSMLKKFAGGGSVLNCLEFRSGMLHGVKDQEENVNNNNNDNNQIGQTCSVDVNKEDDTETNTEVDQTHIHHRKKGDGWKGLVDAYYPELVAKYNGQYYGNNGAIRALQKELCTDENGVLDAQKLKQLYRATDIPKEIKMPLQVEGVNRVIGNVKPVNTNSRGQYRKPLERVGRNAISNVKQVQPGVYIATDGCDGQKASGSTQKEAVQNLKKTTGKTYSNENDF